jgi:hypothetical protein
VEGGITGDKQFRGSMKSKVSQTISEILDLKKEMYAQTGNLDRM